MHANALERRCSEHSKKRRKNKRTGTEQMTNISYGAILQRDGKTCAIMTNNPAGIITTEELEQVSSVGKKNITYLS
jgi:NAD(P)H-nitrite reductase large subunit